MGSGMRVAVVSPWSPDYLIDIVADGMIRLLGRQSVFVGYSIKKTEDPRLSQLFERLSEPNNIGLKDCDCLVLSVRNNSNYPGEFKQASSKTAVAVIDGEDDDLIREEFRRQATVYFKREHIPGWAYPANVKPLLFASIPEPVPPDALRDTTSSLPLEPRTCTATTSAVGSRKWGMGVSRSCPDPLT